MADLLKYYKIHISQLSPLGMVRALHYEYCFWSQKIEPTIEHFRCFYQLQAQLGFYSFFARRGAKRILVVPPKGFHEWKSKFFYIKAATIAYKLEIRSVYRKIPRETLVGPEFQEWYGALKALPLTAVSKDGLTIMRMMLRWKPGSRKKPVCREKGKVVPLWRMFASDRKGRIVTESCDDDEEG
ncbi:hypothetical protein HanIR_Chr15g0776821 [Helianthus annuus]|nr:hypothetical protein HanIR_Chr15g0776821 [Helianthus annuus]